MSELLFDGWQGIWRTAVVGVLAYAALITILRVSGKRTLSKMNAFDLVVTVALGSTLATILLSSDVALAEGVTALGLLVGLQFLIAWLSTRSPMVSRLVKAEPTLLLYQGQQLPEALQRERVTEGELLAALRTSGLVDPSQAEAVVLETDGSFTVLRRTTQPSPGALDAVRGYPRAS